MRLLSDHPFYGMLLMHTGFALDEGIETAGTDGRKIYFSPGFMENLSDKELDFIMMHEILHIVLRHGSREQKRNSALFNEACDIVVNSNILKSNGMRLDSITLSEYGESMHLVSGEEGYKYTAEEVYRIMYYDLKSKGIDPENLKFKALSTFDDHTRWKDLSGKEKDEWRKHICDACSAISIRDPSNQRGQLPLFAERMIEEIKNPKVDWRTVLNDFIEEEICDYSFSPPDRRFDDFDFMIPAFNDTEAVVKNILFMIDTSGSVSDEMLCDAYSEIYGAVERFNGKLQGSLGFFDCEVTDPIPFSSPEELLEIKPKGGGGTDFDIIFEYVFDKMADELPTGIIILTDGFAPIPDESKAKGIPVLWIISNDVVVPEWGKVINTDSSGSFRY